MFELKSFRLYGLIYFGKVLKIVKPGKFLFILTTSTVILNACGPSFKSKKFFNELTFIHTGDPVEKADDTIVEAEPRNVLATTQEIQDALNLRSIDKYDKDLITKEVNEIEAIVQNDNFVITDAELSEVNEKFLSNQTDKNNFVRIDSGKNVYPRLKPLVINRLYQMEIVKEKGTVAIPGVVFLSKIKVNTVDRQRNESISASAQHVLSKLKTANLQIKIVRLYGRDQIVQLTATSNKTKKSNGSSHESDVTSELIGFGRISSKGALEAMPFGLLEALNVQKIINTDANDLIESLLINNSFNLTLVDDKNHLIGDFKFNSLENENKEINKLKNNLTFRNF